MPTHTAKAGILIVDRDEKSRDFLRRILLDAHPEYKVSFASRSEEALDLVRSETPDLIFLDVLMPDNEGFDLCLLLKCDERFKDIPVLIITALDRLEHKVRAFNVGASDYILKPINAVETNARVQAQLKMKAFQDRQKELNAELRRAQEALIETTKLSAAGALAAGVAHEFNNILQIMSAATDLYSTTGDAADRARLFEVVRACTDRGGRIARGLMDFARKGEAAKKERVNLAEIVRSNLGLLQKRFDDAGVEVMACIEPVPTFEGYPSQLSEAFVHLAKNALEAMKQAKRKSLTVTLAACGCSGSACEGDPLRQRERGAGCLRLVVSDTGTGVPADLKGRIFEPFVTTKGLLGGGQENTPGTGLGLSVTHGIIRRHGGFISVDSPPGQGATFTVSIPL